MENIDFSSCIPKWFNDQFDGGSIVRIVDSDEDAMEFGFAFCVAFEVSNLSANSASTQDSFASALPHPFYLSFESEHTEERFDMPLSLELHKVDGSKYLWLIYISQEHCHFLKTGAHITFKAGPGLILKKWGLRKLIHEKMPYSRPTISEPFMESDACQLVLDFVQKPAATLDLKSSFPTIG